MGLFFFYNNRKPRKFNHRPILFDPEKEARREEMEKRIRRMKEEVAREEGRPIEPYAEERKTDFKEEFLSQTKYLKKRKEREEGDNKPFYANTTTIVLFLAVLIVLFYILFLR